MEKGGGREEGEKVTETTVTCTSCADSAVRLQ